MARRRRPHVMLYRRHHAFIRPGSVHQSKSLLRNVPVFATQRCPVLNRHKKKFKRVQLSHRFLTSRRAPVPGDTAVRGGYFFITLKPPPARQSHSESWWRSARARSRLR
jgi:hypothetical protein